MGRVVREGVTEPPFASTPMSKRGYLDPYPYPYPPILLSCNTRLGGSLGMRGMRNLFRRARRRPLPAVTDIRRMIPTVRAGCSAWLLGVWRKRRRKRFEEERTLS
eukprot:757436-Hanusia_phi.AAC.5